LRPDELDLTRLSIAYRQGRIYTSGAGKAQTKKKPVPLSQIFIDMKERKRRL